LQGEITKRGVVHLLRNGLDHLGQHIDLYYPTPTEGNTKAADCDRLIWPHRDGLIWPHWRLAGVVVTV